MLVLAYEDYLRPAQQLATALPCESQIIKIHHFPDGESKITLPATLPHTVILVRSLDNPNAKLVELIISAECARQNGAKQVILVAPYLCYMRQDMAFRPGEAISQKIVGAMLGDYFDAVITVDPHLHRISHLNQAITHGKAIALSAAPLMGQRLLQAGERPLLVGPDEESAQWVELVAEPAKLSYVVATKVRHGDRHVEITLPDVDYCGKDIVLVDDVISSGQTLIRCAQLLREQGCHKVSALCTHPLLAPGAEKALQEAGITSLLSSDSILHASNCLALAPLLSEAVKSLLEKQPSSGILTNILHAT